MVLVDKNVITVMRAARSLKRLYAASILKFVYENERCCQNDIVEHFVNQFPYTTPQTIQSSVSQCIRPLKELGVLKGNDNKSAKQEYRIDKGRIASFKNFRKELIFPEMYKLEGGTEIERLINSIEDIFDKIRPLYSKNRMLITQTVADFNEHNVYPLQKEVYGNDCLKMEQSVFNSNFTILKNGGYTSTKPDGKARRVVANKAEVDRVLNLCKKYFDNIQISDCNDDKDND